MASDFLSAKEIAVLGLRHVGRAVRISRHALILAPERLSIGDYSRIDAFCIISAGPSAVTIGRNVHISAYASILGRAEVTIGDFAMVSVRCSIFSSSDDFTGATMTNSTIPDEFRGAVDAPVIVGRHAVLGAAVIVLPGVRVGESVSVGAGSLLKSDIPDSAIVAGIPARVIGNRLPGHRTLAEQFIGRTPVDRGDAD